MQHFKLQIKTNIRTQEKHTYLSIQIFSTWGTSTWSRRMIVWSGNFCFHERTQSEVGTQWLVETPVTELAAEKLAAELALVLFKLLFTDEVASELDESIESVGLKGGETYNVLKQFLMIFQQQQQQQKKNIRSWKSYILVISNIWIKQFF